MRIQFSRKMIGISLAVICSNACLAQNILGKRDSLPVLKPKPLLKQYQVNHQGLQEYSISAKKPKRVEATPKKTSESFMGGAITLFTGLNTSSSTDGLWMMLGELSGEGNATSWKMPFYFQGTFIKDRQRVKNDDGSSSLEVAKGLSIDWDQESYGFIYDNQDTIGYFTLVTNLSDDPTSLQWLSALKREGSKAIKKSKFAVRVLVKDFKVNLAFRRRSFTILSQSEHFRILILIDGKPAATFQSDPDYVVLGKANRKTPYILFADEISDDDKADILRLSLLGVLLRNIVSNDMHDM